MMRVLDSDGMETDDLATSDPDAGGGGSRSTVGSHAGDSMASSFVAWATGAEAARSSRLGRWWRMASRPRRGSAVAATATAVIDVVLITLIVATAALPQPAGPAIVGDETAPPTRGDPVQAGQLAQQAEQVAGSDPVGHIRLLLAAHVVDPDSRAHKNALAEALLRDGSPVPAAALAPVKLAETDLDVGEPIRYAAATFDGSYLVTSGPTKAHLWSTRDVTDEPRVTLEDTFQPVTAAAGGGGLWRGTLVTAHPGGVNHWALTYPVGANADGSLGTRADAVAVAADGSVAVTVDGTTATVWTVGTGVEARGTISYPRPPTAIAFAPNEGPDLTLAAGHGDGTVTIHSLSLDDERANRRLLTGAGGPVDAVAVSADASTVLAVHVDGGLSVWDIGRDPVQPAAAIAGAVTPGAHQVWLTSTGDFGIVGDGSGGVTLWSLVNAQQPSRLRGLRDAGLAPQLGLITADGRYLMTIDETDVLTIWSLAPVTAAIDEPIDLACRTAQPDNATWRRMVPNPAYANPCRPPALPELDATPSPRPT